MTEPTAPDDGNASGVPSRTEPAAPKTFRNNLKWQMVGSASQAVASGLGLLLMGRVLGATGFGVFSIILAAVYLANALLEPRMQDVAAKQFWNVREDANPKPAIYDFFLLEGLAKLIPCIGLTLLAPLVAHVSNLPAGSTTLIVLAAIGVYISKLGWGLAAGLLRVLGRSDLLTAFSTGDLVFRLLAMGALAAVGQLTVFWCVVILCISGSVSNILQWIVLLRQFEEDPAAAGGRSLASVLARLRENRHLILSNIGLSVSDLMSKDLDVTLIAPILPAGQVGVYKMAKNIAWLVWRAIEPFSLSLMPEVNRLVASGNPSQLRRLLWRTSALLFAVGSTMAVSVVIALHLFGAHVLGPAFGEVATLIPWIMLGIVGCAPLVWGHPLSVALHCPAITVAGSFMGMIGGLGLLFTLVPLYGIYGAAISSTASFLINFGSIAIITYRRFDKHVAAMS